ncbi:HEAT repeat-containing protein 5B isoform X5 [Panicum miliaceum]|uniref:HEAT repeat-containing protein 5B isoform X5 n=1 Tax=Panicum miliaceum TaxID=4540 RepID=A0A3L6PHN2_PANMI|nr:HEAT repeat-containing protein 5B isoform X5 [Panicum miliaceum]
MAKGGGGEPIPLSRFGALVAQLESVETIQLWQRKCEDALQSLLVLGARRPVRRLASSAMGRIIEKGDAISVYSRASTLQGWLVDVKRAEPTACAGFAKPWTKPRMGQDFVRQDALLLLENALEGSGGGGGAAAYQEAFRIIMRGGVSDKSFIVRVAAARCLKAFANIGGPGLGMAEFDNSMFYCVKGLEDSVSSVRDSFAEALGAILALSVNPDAQVKKGGKKQTASAKKLEDGVQKHLIVPFVKANGANVKKLRIGLALSWVFFLQMIHMKYGTPDSELQNYAIQVMEILQGNDYPDPHALACVLYVLRVGVADQMTEPTQRELLVFLGRKLESSNYTAPMRVAALRILSYLLRSLGEVPAEFKDVLDNTVVAALSHSSAHVRVEAALTLRALAEVDPTCVGGLVSYGVTTLHALGETVSFDKGKNLNVELDSLHGQATVLAALVAISPKLLLGYPASTAMLCYSYTVKCGGYPYFTVQSALRQDECRPELEDQVFDVLLLWAGPFTGNPESYLRHIQDWASELRVLSVAIEALTAFIRSFVYPIITTADGGILLNPVLAYLGGALSLISSLKSKPVPDVKSALDLFATRTLMAYQSLSNPVVYKSEHQQMLQLCSSPFSDPSGWEESSCLKFLLDKRDASLGPWIPGRDSFEDELRAFDGGVDGFLPCVWDDEISNFPQPESVRKMLVNQTLLCYGSIFACQENTVKIGLLSNLDQCLKSGKKYPWFTCLVTNTCVAILSGLKEFLTLRGAQSLPIDILSMIQSIFKLLQAILGETEISTAQRRAACEGLGLLARVGNDIFTARMARSLLGELITATDLSYTASVAFSLGCIHRSAGGMALSTLVTPTVSSLSSLSKSLNSNLQLWSLHALLLTIEAAGLSYVSQVQGTLFLAMEILLLEENGYVDLRQGIGHLINAIVAVLGPELAPGSTFFSRCKSVIVEISSSNEMATLLESVRFAQQLVLFAPQAVPVHAHVQGLIPTLYSRQPSLRYLAVSTLRHLIERDPVLATSITRNTGEVLSSSGHNPPDSTPENDVYYGEDEDNMISSSKQEQFNRAASISSQFPQRNKHLRYRTRVFAAECVSHVPIAVGAEPAHFDLLLARSAIAKGTHLSNDWLVLKLQELVSLSYQISTGQFEGMQPIGVKLLCLIMDKFAMAVDPEFPGHILLEQFQAQLVSAVRTAINTASDPLLLEAGLELATRVMTSSIIGGDRVALNRLFSLISCPLSDIEGLFYPSFADWVVCKIKVRLLTAHAAVKCYTYQFLRMKENAPDEYQQLAPSLVNSSTLLGKYWIGVLKDYVSISFGLHSKINYKPFLDGIQSLLVSSKVQKYLDEVWTLILQATALDAAPMEFDMNKSDGLLELTFISGHCMVKLDRTEFEFLWGLSILALFRARQSLKNSSLKIILNFRQDKNFGGFIVQGLDDQKPCDQVLPVFLSLTAEVFFSNNFLSVGICQELLQALTYADCSSAPIIRLFTQVIRLCPDSFFEVEAFVSSAFELFSQYLGMILQCRDGSSQKYSSNTLISELSIASEMMASRMKGECKIALVLPFMEPNSLSHLAGSVEADDDTERAESDGEHMHPKVVLGASVSLVAYFCTECAKRISLLENKISDSYKLLAKILLFCLGEATVFAKLVHEIGNLSENGSSNDVLLWGSFRQCVQVIQGSLHSTNIQVHMLGLHVLRSYAQKELTEGSETKTDSFMMLLTELLGDVFLVMQTTLKECSNKESVSVIDECLKLLFLFHTLAQSKKYQQDATTLLLEALLMVFYLSSDTVSQELAEVNTISKKLFSHFIHIPSVAIQLKDIMLSAPPERRQQLQDMVRASVSQGQITVPVNMSARSEQNVQNSNIKQNVQDINKTPGLSAESTPEGSECCATQGKDEKEIPQENISDADITAGAMEGGTCGKELEEPSDLQYTSTEQQANHEFPGSSQEDNVKLERHPTVDCKKPLAHIEVADELLQVHEDTDQASEDLKGVSTEIHRIEVDVHDGNITSKDDSTRNSSNLSDIIEDESKGSDIALRVDGKFVKDESKKELSG